MIRMGGTLICPIPIPFYKLESVKFNQIHIGQANKSYQHK